ncbi:MAG: dienelactone hydrolase family protein [Gemmatimonadetes bacterium]|nr:dienelactone hydrolase family protein [Gemmatimonadota bacterium]
MRARSLFSVVALAAASACSREPAQPPAAASNADPHTGHAMTEMSGATVADPTSGMQGTAGIPAGAADAAARLGASTRHGEWVKIAWEAGSADSLMAWVVFPEQKKKAPVVVVIHEIFGLSTWVRGVADQLAADGFIAVAPDLLSRVRGGPTADELRSDSATKLIRGVNVTEMNRGVTAAANYGMALPAARKSYGVVGYCWGGSASFNHAVLNNAGLGAAVVYYGTSAAKDSMPKISAPVLGLYGGNDARVNATIGWADTTMKDLKKSYTYQIFDGAGHGFLRAQDQPANLEAAKQAWPLTLAFFRKNLK